MAILGVDVGGTFTDAVLLARGGSTPRRCRPAPTGGVGRRGRTVVLDAAGAAARALHARDDGGDERTARAEGRADGVRRDRGLRAPPPSAAAEPGPPLSPRRRPSRAPRPARALLRRPGANRAERRRHAARPLEPARGRSRGHRRLSPLLVPGPVARAAVAAELRRRHPRRTSSRRTRSHPSSASTSGRRRPPPTRTGPVPPAICALGERPRPPGCPPARDALLGRRRDARGGGGPSCAHPRLRSGGGRRCGGAHRRAPASRTRSHSTWAARRPTSA